MLNNDAGQPDITVGAEAGTHQTDIKAPPSQLPRRGDRHRIKSNKNAPSSSLLFELPPTVPRRNRSDRKFTMPGPSWSLLLEVPIADEVQYFHEMGLQEQSPNPDPWQNNPMDAENVNQAHIKELIPPEHSPAQLDEMGLQEKSPNPELIPPEHSPAQLDEMGLQEKSPNPELIPPEHSPAQLDEMGLQEKSPNPEPRQNNPMDAENVNQAHIKELIPPEPSPAQLYVLKQQFFGDEGTSPDKDPSKDLDIHELKDSTQLGGNEGPHQSSSHLETPQSKGKNIILDNSQIRKQKISPKQLEMLRARGRNQYCKICATWFEAALDDKIVCSSCKRAYHAKCVNLPPVWKLYSKVYKCPTCIESNFETDTP